MRLKYPLVHVDDVTPENMNTPEMKDLLAPPLEKYLK